MVSWDCYDLGSCIVYVYEVYRAYRVCRLRVSRNLHSLINSKANSDGFEHDRGWSRGQQRTLKLLAQGIGNSDLRSRAFKLDPVLEGLSSSQSLQSTQAPTSAARLPAQEAGEVERLLSSRLAA